MRSEKGYCYRKAGDTVNRGGETFVKGEGMCDYGCRENVDRCWKTFCVPNFFILFLLSFFFIYFFSFLSFNLSFCFFILLSLPSSFLLFTFILSSSRCLCISLSVSERKLSSLIPVITWEKLRKINCRDNHISYYLLLPPVSSCSSLRQARSHGAFTMTLGTCSPKECQ